MEPPIISNMNESNDIRALIIADSIGQADEWQQIVGKSQCKDRIRPIYPSAIKKDKASIHSLMQDCKSTIEEEGDIDAILTVNKDHALIQSVLVSELQLAKQKIPSFESLVVLLHKYYTNHRLLHGFNFAFKCVEVEDATLSDYEFALDEAGDPALLTDAVSSQNMLRRKVTQDKLGIKDIESIRKLVTKNFETFRDLLEAHTPKGRENYPHIFEPLCILNEYWKAYDKDASFHHAECCVSTSAKTGKQELVPWALTDLVYCTGKRRSLMYESVPSEIPSDTNVWAVLNEVYELLLGFGFRNYFFNAIVISSKSNGDVKVADINVGIIKENIDLYKHVLLQGDNVKAFVEAGLGKMQRTPKVWPNKFAMRAELKTFIDTSSTVDEVIDLKAARSIPEVELHVYSNEQNVVHDMDEGGMHIASVHLTGSSKEGCLDNFAGICNQILRIKTKLNWNLDSLTQEQTK